MSKKLLKLFKYFLIFNLVFCFFISVLYILEGFDLLTSQQTKIITSYIGSTILIASSYKYFHAIDIKQLKAIKIKFWPTPICLLSSLFLFILYNIFSNLILRIIMDYSSNFYPKYLKDLQDQANYFQLLYKGLSYKAFLIISITSTCILPALGEELFFRGVLQNIFLTKLKNPLPAIALSALLFSAIHFMPYTSIYFFLKGLLYGSIYYITGSLFLPILGHFLNNITCTLVRDYPNHSTSAATEIPIETWLSIPICITGIIICLFLGYCCFKALHLCRKKTTMDIG